QERGEDAQERGLARSVRSREGEAAARLQGERDLLEGGGEAVALAKVRRLHHEIGSGQRRRLLAHRVRSGCDQSLIALRRAMRSSIGGCVENRVARPPAVSGVTMNGWGVAGVASRGTCREAMSSFWSACA